MHGRRGETAVHSRVGRGPLSGARGTGVHARPATDALDPRVCGQPVEHYFYPNSAVPVFCPSMEQFADFEALVSAIEPLALRGGVCKIIPPRKWRADLEARRSGAQQQQQSSGPSAVHVFDEDWFPIMRPIVQHFNGSRGTFHQYNVEYHRKLKLAQFFQLSQDASHRKPDIRVAVQSDDDAEDGGRAKPREDEEGVAVVESETAGVAVDFDAGVVRLTSTAADAVQRGIRSEGQRVNFRPAVARYKPQPDTAGEAAADHVGGRQARRFTEDGRALFVTEREYAENEELERIYWKNMLFQPPMYGADVLGTLFPPVEEFPAWNIRNLPGLLRQIGQRMPGVNDPYLYLGMWKATFAWHVEDMDLYSINYIHFGEPKAWFAIPIEARSRFEMSMQNIFANDHKNCSQFLRHKSFLLSPRFLASQGIPFNRVVQRAGEIILTFPLGYHAGFNHGFNCAESVNFALERWLDVAWDSKHCECVKDSVTIDLMEWFGDARRARVQQQRREEEEEGRGRDEDSRGRAAAKHGPPRRHAAAAVAISSGPERLAAKKRRPSAGPKAEPSAKRSPQKAQKPGTGGRGELEPVDVRRRYASLNTPVGTCGACLVPIDAEAKAAEDFVECLQCGLTVHPQCSALTHDDGQYRCANCEMDTDQLSCALCAYQNGLLLPTKPNGASDNVTFAHFLCASFISETFFDFPADDASLGAGRGERMGTRSRTAAAMARAAEDEAEGGGGVMRGSAKVCGIKSISKSRFAARCIYCVEGANAGVGPVAQCAHPKCFRSFHPMCAAVVDPGLLDWSGYKAYCQAHLPH
ncbi:hypothetical protein GGF46_001481 [Coemansia sp. RSA 552]|nr:hypothetical protein GGF46_001481 [Coemansia sp. RSA 552]